MQAIFGELQETWSKANRRRMRVPFGIEIVQGLRNLTELRFADDVILVAQSRSDIQKMLQHLETTSAKFGLKINFGKTRVLTWNALSLPSTSIMLGEQSVAILDECASESYLGRKLAFSASQDIELRHRIASGWAAFAKHKSELCCKHYQLKDRLKLFDAVVTPAFSYGCSTWALTKKMDKKLQVSRRRMLRYAFRIYRKKAEGNDEDWHAYLSRANAKINQLSHDHGMQEWVETQKKA